MNENGNNVDISAKSVPSERLLAMARDLRRSVRSLPGEAQGPTDNLIQIFDPKKAVNPAMRDALIRRQMRYLERALQPSGRV